HLRPLALSAAADQLAAPRRRRSRRHDREQVRPPRRRQAHLQSHECRHRRDDAADGSRLGVAGAVGQRRLLRVPHGVSRRPSREPCRRSIGSFRARATRGRAPERAAWLQKRVLMKRLVVTAIVLAALGWSGPTLLGFCGFYVAKADTKLFNKASQVVLVRQDDKTVLTMANDFKGDPKEFAIVVPVPTVLEKDQIHVGDKALLDHLDAYSAPRLVEYFDPDPCVALNEHLAAFSRRNGLAAPMA